MRAGLVGRTGFVGSTLQKQTVFAEGYRSTDIQRIEGAKFDLLVCAGAPAKKWMANQDPATDLAAIETLAEHLMLVRARKVVLISTVDVFGEPRGVDEFSEAGGFGVTAYGRHRLLLERLLQERFDCLVVRLPGLVGPGLRKNVLFDLKHENQMQGIDSRGIFQFYPMVNLWFDVQRALALELDLVHLTAAPLKVSDIAAEAYSRTFVNELHSSPPIYDFHSRYGEEFGGSGHYHYSTRESMLAIRAYAQGEPTAERR